MHKQHKTKTAIIAIAGSPNAGKSTLLNTIMNQKLAMTSPKVQATRSNTRACLNVGDTQLIFVDTPGLIEPKTKLQCNLMANAKRGLKDADFTIILIDPENLDEQISRHILSTKSNLIFAVNKMDAFQKGKISGNIQHYISLLAREANHGDDDTNIFYISALHNTGIDSMLSYISANSPHAPWLFDEEDYTDITEKTLAEEITRESIYKHLQQEIPYNTKVATESWQDISDTHVSIKQIIYVLKESQKPIVIGKQASKIKKIGESARRDISIALNKTVELFLRVKVNSEWIDKL